MASESTTLTHNSGPFTGKVDIENGVITRFHIRADRDEYAMSLYIRELSIRSAAELRELHQLLYTLEGIAARHEPVEPNFRVTYSNC